MFVNFDGADSQNLQTSGEKISPISEDVETSRAMSCLHPAKNQSFRQPICGGLHSQKKH